MATVGPFDDEAPLLPSEYDGDSGLVQPAAKGHVPTPAERLGMVNRLDGTTSVDPVTGTVQPQDV